MGIKKKLAALLGFVRCGLRCSDCGSPDRGCCAAKQPEKAKLTEQEVDESIQSAIETENGRVAIAMSMWKPILRSLDNRSLARKCLVTKQLRQCEIAKVPYDGREVFSLTKNNEVFVQMEDPKAGADYATISDFEIAAHPQVSLSRAQTDLAGTVDAACVGAADEMKRGEEAKLIRLFETVISHRKGGVVKAYSLCKSDVDKALLRVTTELSPAAKIIINPERYYDFKDALGDDFEEAGTRELLCTGLYGHYRTADVHVSESVPVDTFYVTGLPEEVGVMFFRQDVTVLPADDPLKLRLGWAVYEDVGFAVKNKEKVAKLVVDDGYVSWRDEAEAEEQNKAMLDGISTGYICPKKTWEEVIDSLKTKLKEPSENVRRLVNIAGEIDLDDDPGCHDSAQELYGVSTVEAVEIGERANPDNNILKTVSEHPFYNGGNPFSSNNARKIKAVEYDSGVKTEREIKKPWSTTLALNERKNFAVDFDKYKTLREQVRKIAKTACDPMCPPQGCEGCELPKDDLTPENQDSSPNE